MAEDAESDDQWLYGDPAESGGSKDVPPLEKPSVEEHPDEIPKEPLELDPTTVDEAEKPPNVEEEVQNEPETKNPDEEDGEVQQNGEEEEMDDDSDDDVNVVIGDIKTTTSYTSLNIKRGGNLLTTAAAVDKNKQVQPQAGKFSVDEFDQSGMINGVPAVEYNLDSLEDKPWRKPGADITDYFNYGFNEDTWRAYCERQKRMRLSESGVGLAAQMTSVARGTIPIMNDNSKYSGNFLGIRKAGPPPGRRMTGAIDVIGATAQRPPPTPVGKMEPPKMNVIQVMTADRREYSRKPAGFPDMSVPPPATFEGFQPEYGFNPEPEPFYGGYEPTQDSQWGTDNNWAPNDIKSLSTGPPVQMGPPVNMPMSVSRRSESPSRRDNSKERDERSRGRSERPRDRERERSHRRERSRSRSRRHKSRSRSPSHRSHRKKKSRRHEESD